MDDNENNNGRLLVPPFDYLSGNVKGRFEHRFTSRCIAFVGPNRRGKTARLDAIRLALTGKHPVGPHGTDLFQLAPESALSLSAVLRGAELSTSFVVEVEGGKPRKPPERPDRTGVLKTIEGLPGSDRLFENMLPTLSMRDLIKGATLTREAVFRRFGEISALPVPRGLTADQLAQWQLAEAEVRKTKTTMDVAEVLSGMSAYFRRMKLERGREIKALEKLLKEREAALVPIAAGSEDLPQMKKQLQDAEAWEGTAELRVRKAEIEKDVEAYRLKVAPYIQADEHRAEREAETAAQEQARQATLDDLTQQIGVLETQLKHLEADYEQASSVTSSEAEQEKEKIRSTYTARLEDELEMLHGGAWLMKCLAIMAKKVDDHGNAPCVLCTGPVDVAELTASIGPRVQARKASVQKLKDEQEAKLTSVCSARDAALKKMADQHNKEVTKRQKEIVALREARVATEVEYARWKGEILAKKQAEEEAKNLLKQEYERIKSARTENARALENVPEQYDGPTAEVLRTRIQALEAAATASRQLDAEIGNLRRLGQEQELFKLLETEGARELNTLLTRTAETANATVNKYMPDGFRAQLDLEESQWTVIGMDDRPHGKKVMSGSEFGALVPALAEGWTEGAPGRYVLLDDEDLAAFDPANLALLLQTLKDACDDGLLTQVFVAWSRPHEVPDGWGQKIYVHAPEPALREPPTAVASESGPALLL